MPKTRRLRPEASATTPRGVQHTQRPSPVTDAVAGSGRCDSFLGTAGAAFGRTSVRAVRTAALGCAADPIRREHPAWACFGIVAALSVAIWWPWPVRLLLVLVEVSQ